MKLRNLHNVTLQFLQPDLTTPFEVPFYDDGVSAGFPSPANDFQELKISFDKEVFGSSPSTTFCARVSGHSMKNAGISDGDIIVVDRLLEPKDGDIAVCVINNDFTLKRIKIEKDCVWLIPENEDFAPVQITDSESFSIWGILTYTLKKHR